MALITGNYLDYCNEHISPNHIVIARIKSLCDKPSDKALAAFLHTTPGSVATWVHAKTPPFHACFLASQKTGIPMEWFLTGKPQASFTLPDITETQCVTAFVTTMRMAQTMGLIATDESPAVLQEAFKRLGETLYKKLMKSVSH